MSTPPLEQRERLRMQPELKGNYAAKLMSGNDRSRAMLVKSKKFRGLREISAREKAAKEAKPPTELEISDAQGFRVFQPGFFEEAAAMNELARETVSQLKSEDLQTKKSQLKVDLLEMESFSLDSPQVKWALRPDILAAVSNYLGVVPILSNIDVWYSIHAGPTPINSQLYHCDVLDVRQIKFFLYANAVTDSDGPLTVIGADSSKRLRDKLDYTYEGKRKRVTDEQVAEVLGDQDQHPITGEAGTSAFVDSSRCFHFGSRVKEGGSSRILTMVQYLLPTAFVFPAGNFREKAPFRHLDSPELSRLQRMALGAI